jgi:hypothetical protein
LRSEWRALDERIAAFDAEFVRMAREDEAVRRLTTIPGIGTINATALAAAVGNARAFGRGRDMLGLTPRQMTTGGKPRLQTTKPTAGTSGLTNTIDMGPAPPPIGGLQGSSRANNGSEPASMAGIMGRQRQAQPVTPSIVSL